MAQNLNGWISLNRKFLNWQFFDDAKAVKLFVYMLLAATPKDYKFGQIVVKRGQLLTSSRELEKNTQISRQEIRTILSKFQREKIIDIQANRHFSIIGFLNYNFYQKNSENFGKKINPQNNPKINPKNNPQINPPENASIEVISGNINPQNNPQNNPQINPQDNPPYINKINNLNKNICDCYTRESFENELKKYETKYSKEFLQSFFAWYTKKAKNGKMRFQNLEFTDIEFYLKKWEETSKKLESIKIAPAKNSANSGPVAHATIEAAAFLTTTN